MAGTATVSTSLIAALESLNTLVSKLSRMITEAVFAGFSDSEAGTTIVVPRVQSSAPSDADYDVWSDTALIALRINQGAAGVKRWIPPGLGEVMVNGTGSSRTAGQIVGVTSAASDRNFNVDPEATAATSLGIVGVLDESAASAASGLVRQAGWVARVKVSGAITRGAFLTRDGVGTAYHAVSGGTTLTPSMGIALQSKGVGDGEVRAILWSWNQT